MKTLGKVLAAILVIASGCVLIDNILSDEPFLHVALWALNGWAVVFLLLLMKD